MKVLGVIPARGGSKGIPGKALRILGDQTVLAWTVDGARRVPVRDLVLTTDDPRIAAEGTRLRLDVIDRPWALAQDETPMWPVVQHVLDVLGGDWTHVLLLQPTHPFRAVEDVRLALQWADEDPDRAIVSVTRAYQHPASLYWDDPEGLFPVDWGGQGSRRQDRGVVWAVEGGIYLLPVPLLRETGMFVPPGARPLEVERGVNLDTEADWQEALRVA